MPHWHAAHRHAARRGACHKHSCLACLPQPLLLPHVVPIYFLCFYCCGGYCCWQAARNFSMCFCRASAVRRGEGRGTSTCGSGSSSLEGGRSGAKRPGWMVMHAYLGMWLTV